MKRQYSESEKELVKAVVGLFILLPNPQLKGKEDEVMEIAFKILDRRLDDIQLEDEVDEDEISEEYIKYIVDKHK